MTVPDDATMRSEGLAFFGRMTAGQSHEVTNVLNIINEVAGLQIDLLTAAAAGREPDLQRLAELAHRIQSQVARGQTIIRNVNRFAHSVDLPVAVFEVGEVLERVVFLAQRTAALNRVGLSLRPPEESITIESNPFCVQQAVFCCIDLAVAAADDRRRVTVTYGAAGEEGVELEVAAADPVPADTTARERLDFLRALLTELGGSVSSAPDVGDEDRFTMWIPRRRGGSSGRGQPGGQNAT